MYTFCACRLAANQNRNEVRTFRSEERIAGKHRAAKADPSHRPVPQTRARRRPAPGDTRHPSGRPRRRAGPSSIHPAPGQPAGHEGYQDHQDYQRTQREHQTSS